MMLSDTYLIAETIFEFKIGLFRSIIYAHVHDVFLAKGTLNLVKFSGKSEDKAKWTELTFFCEWIIASSVMPLSIEA